jgi:serine/threonine-protein kinase
MNEWVGRSLGKVRIDSLLARGGMAEVYLGVHTSLQREVAVKILRAQYADDEDLLERFQREAQVVAKLRHQNIVQVFDYDSIDDHPYIVMEYITGPSLSKHLSVLHKNNRRLDLPEISRILLGVAYALQYAHNAGVVHRDIKPGNVILTSHTTPIAAGDRLPEDFEPVLTDFGLVRFLNSSRQTSAGQTAGTPAYMSPEQARGETTDARTDIYSLGIVLYEMLTGRVPFDGETTMSILLKHITDPPPPVSGLDPALQNVLNRALAKNKEDRYQSPSEFALAFKAVAELKVEASTFMGITPITDVINAIPVSDSGKSLIVDTPAPPHKPRRKWVPVVLGAVALTALGVLVTFNGIASKAPTPTITLAASATNTQRPSISLSGLGSIAVLRLRDGDSVMDQAVLEAFALPSPPAGNQYEAWLVGGANRLRLGILQVDDSGRGILIFNAGQNENLLGLYDQIELLLVDLATGEPIKVAYSYALPRDGLVFLRLMLVSFPDASGQPSLIESFSSDLDLLVDGVNDVFEAHSQSNLAGAVRSAEAVSNLIVGEQSSDHKDWNNDGVTESPGSGYGFLVNGINPGHIQAIYTHADFAANSPSASQNMIAHGAEVKVCSENLALWIAELQDQVTIIRSAQSLAEMESAVKEAERLLVQIQDGVDSDASGRVDPIAGECGASTLVTSAYAMSDMPLLPINVIGTPADGTTTVTPTATRTFAPGSGPTTSGGGGGGGGGGAPTATKKGNSGGGNTPPGQEKTKRP